MCFFQVKTDRKVKLDRSPFLSYGATRPSIFAMMYTANDCSLNASQFIDVVVTESRSEYEGLPENLITRRYAKRCNDVSADNLRDWEIHCLP